MPFRPAVAASDPESAVKSVNELVARQAGAKAVGDFFTIEEIIDPATRERLIAIRFLVAPGKSATLLTIDSSGNVEAKGTVTGSINFANKGRDPGGG